MATEFTAVDYIFTYVIALAVFVGFGLFCALVYRWIKKGNKNEENH